MKTSEDPNSEYSSDMCAESSPSVCAFARLTSVVIAATITATLWFFVRNLAGTLLSIATNVDLLYHCLGQISHRYRDVVIVAWRTGDRTYRVLAVFRLLQLGCEIASLYFIGLVFSLGPYLSLRLGAAKRLSVAAFVAIALGEGIYATTIRPITGAFFIPLTYFLVAKEWCPVRGNLSEAVLTLIIRGTLIFVCTLCGPSQYTA